MPDITPRTRERIEAQGFVGLDDRTLSQINYWLRLAPAICMAWTALGTMLGSAATLWALVPFAALGAVLPGHPFDVLYTYGFRRVTAGPPLPRYALLPLMCHRHDAAHDRRCEFSDRPCDRRERSRMVSRGGGVHQRLHRCLHPVVRLRIDVRSAVRLCDGADEEGHVMNPNQAFVGEV